MINRFNKRYISASKSEFINLVAFQSWLTLTINFIKCIFFLSQHLNQGFGCRTASKETGDDTREEFETQLRQMEERVRERDELIGRLEEKLRKGEINSQHLLKEVSHSVIHFLK